MFVLLLSFFLSNNYDVTEIRRVRGVAQDPAALLPRADRQREL